MTLADFQRGMIQAILTDEPPETRTGPGIEVYRMAYRSRLLEALQTSFSATRRWAGEEAFDQAARHHIILNPPTAWTLDNYGAGFDATLAELFGEDPDVAELAWLEWHMQQAFAAPDKTIVTAANLNAAIESNCLSVAAGFAMRETATNCGELWLALNQPDSALAELPGQPRPATMIVWRGLCSPQFRETDAGEARALAEIAHGGGLEGACASLAENQGPDAAKAIAGGYLANWIREELLALDQDV